MPVTAALVTAAVASLRAVALARRHVSLLVAVMKLGILSASDMTLLGGDVSVDPEVAVEKRPKGGKNTGPEGDARKYITSGVESTGGD